MTILVAILAFGFLIIIHELGHFTTAKLTGVKVLDFSIGMGPKILHFKKGETQYALRLLPLGGSCSMEGEDEESDNSRALNNKPIRVRLLILAAGSFMNLLAGFVILLCLFAPQKSVSLPVIDRFADQITEQGNTLAGMMPGDEILRINGENVYVTSDIGMLIERYAGKEYNIVVKRDGKEVLLANQTLEKKQLTFDGEDFYGYGFRYQAADSNLLLSAKTALLTGVDYVRMVRMGLVDLLTGRANASQMSGPVGITSMMGQAMENAQFRGLMQLVAFISINLGIMNLLPLPALDGGRILFLVIEFVRRLFKKKPLNPKYEGYIHLAGLGAFLLLMVYVTFNDIRRLIG